MAEHEVEVSVPSGIPVGNRDVIFRIEKNGELLGSLKVSRGAAVWRPAHSKAHAYRLAWGRFDEAMRSFGRKGRF